MDDSAVLNSDGRRRRYESLVTSLYQDAYRYAFWLCKNRSRAEDLVQETFLRAWRSLDSLKSDGAAKAWLFTILRRENARYYERIRPETVDIEEQAIAADPGFEPDNWLDRQQLRSAIGRLDSDYRDPLLLQVIGGFSGKEIGRILNLNDNTVMTRLFRARNRLREEFNLDLDGGDHKKEDQAS